MGLSTERKVFLGIVCVAGLALVVDRGFLGPGDASAAAPQPAPGVATESPTQAQAVGGVKPAAAVLIERLKSRVVSPGDAQASLGASFSLASLIQSGNESIDLSDLEQAKLGEQTPIPEPQAANLPTLSAVMPSSNGGGGAVLGGKMLRVGQLGPGGYKLLEVKARAVLVEKEGRRYIIEIPMHGGD